MKRNTTIDFLRGFAIIVMILIHVTAYYLKDPIANFVWDYAHFAVPIFIFCSAFIYFERKKDAPLSFSYFYKRARRLILPYYIYLIFYFSLTILFTKSLPSLQKFIDYIILKGNGDYYLSWLVVLFLYLIIIMPLVRFLLNRRILLAGFTLVSFLSSIYFLQNTVNFSFRYIMWLPWSLLIVATWYLVETKQKLISLLIITTLSIVTFILTRYLLLSQSASLVLIQNKYPPNLYYLSYGTASIGGLYLLHYFSHIEDSKLQRFFNFVSKHSYSLFFIHYVYLYIIWDGLHIRNIHWVLFFIFLTIISLLTQAGINRLFFFNIKESEA